MRLMPNHLLEHPTMTAAAEGAAPGGGQRDHLSGGLIRMLGRPKIPGSVVGPFQASEYQPSLLERRSRWISSERGLPANAQA